MPKSTKDEIITTLGRMLQTKRLDDITVTELVERCGISRQAFYYHFSDLYGVVDYGVQRFFKRLGEPGSEQWRAALEKLLALLRENRAVVLNAYRAYERSYVEYDLRQRVAPMVERRVRAVAGRYSVTEDQISFMSEVLTQTLASIIVSWVERGMPASVVERVDDFDILMEGCLGYAMERMSQKNKES